ncbi:MAG: peptidylprolyl isomerase [Anaerolineales bacterium]|nr:peptidylprolyl isomerase [Anaerolineales bacterium]
MTNSSLKLLLVLIALTLFLNACTGTGGTDPVSVPDTPTEVPTAIIPPVAMAVLVNGEGIPITEFEAELVRYQSTYPQGTLDATTQAVLDHFINELLLAQGAAAAGFTLDEAALQARLDTLAVQAGGPEALATWQAAHGYTADSFRQALARQISAAWMRDQITASVPSTIEQVHVRQILLYNAEDARSALAQLQAGADFATLANYYDPFTQGELGWFPRGYLPEAAFEEVAFSLEPGQYSDILQTEAGYHIIMVLELDPAHPLSPDALLTLQLQALADWLVGQRQQSTIILAP